MKVGEMVCREATRNWKKNKKNSRNEQKRYWVASATTDKATKIVNIVLDFEK